MWAENAVWGFTRAQIETQLSFGRASQPEYGKWNARGLEHLPWVCSGEATQSSIMQTELLHFE
jgi:hypothetical protein